MNKKCNAIQSGQALVTMLLFVIISVTISTAAMIIILINAKNTSKVEEADMCKAAAESGIEDALLRILRNSSYTVGTYTLTLNGGNINVNVTNSGSSYTITSSGTCNNTVQTIKATASISNNAIANITWQQI